MQLAWVVAELVHREYSRQATGKWQNGVEQDMDPLWQNLFACLFVLIWIGGVVVLGIRANATGDAYLNRHPLLDGDPFYLYKYADRFRLRGMGGPVWRVYRQPQADPELERLRQKARRQGSYVILWGLGFPMVVFGATVFLIALSYVR